MQSTVIHKATLHLEKKKKFTYNKMLVTHICRYTKRLICVIKQSRRSIPNDPFANLRGEEIREVRVGTRENLVMEVGPE